MVNPLLRPRWIAGHLLVVVAVVSFVLLGGWQWRRHHEKADLRDEVSAAQAIGPVPIADVAAGGFARVIAVGEFDGALETKVLRSRSGVSGETILTPLVLDDGTAVLVARGWVRAGVDHRLGGMPAPQRVAVEGLLWPAEEGSSVPEELGEFVRRIDPEIQQAFAPYELRDEYLILTEQTPGIGTALQLPEVVEIPLGPHLGYAGQWVLFAAVVVAGYPLLLRRTLRRF